jgi:hypothetical protein
MIFLKKVWGILKKYAKRYFIDAMSYMALGLFASLLIGTIIEAIAKIPFLSFLLETGIVDIIKSPYVYGAAADPHPRSGGRSLCGRILHYADRLDRSGCTVLFTAR